MKCNSSSKSKSHVTFNSNLRKQLLVVTTFKNVKSLETCKWLTLVKIPFGNGSFNNVDPAQS